MKSRIKSRFTAKSFVSLLICVLIVMSSMASVFADENDATEPETEVESEIIEETDIVTEDSDEPDLTEEKDDTDTTVDKLITVDVSEDEEDDEDTATPEAGEEILIEDPLPDEPLVEIVSFDDLENERCYSVAEIENGVFRHPFDQGNQAIYDILRQGISDVAFGNRTSTVFTVKYSDLGYTSNYITASELGEDYIYDKSTQTYNQEAVNKAYARLYGDYTTLLYRLLDECPFDLYWYDKTVGFRRSTSSGSITLARDSRGYLLTDSEGKYYFEYKDTAETTYSFTVCQGYSAGDYKVSSTAVAKAVAASNNAKAIVNKYKSLSDIEKLTKYKEEICGLVDYNFPAYENDDTPYGDPWQCVYVFDNDDSTKVVCEGYAKAFKYLCDLTDFASNDLTCICASGNFSSTSGTNGGHAWNVVSFGKGLNFLVDCTNCDKGMTGYPNSLFLQKYSSTSSIYSYSFTTKSYTLTYTYYDKIQELFNDSILTLSSTSLLNAPAITFSSSCKGVNLSWASVSGASTYEVYRRTTGDWKYLGKASGTTFLDGTAVSGTKYYYGVRAVNSSGKYLNTLDYNYYLTYSSSHNLVKDAYVAPTCTKSGLTEGYHCSVCGYVKTAQQEIPATGHTEVIDPSVLPSCSNTGLTQGSHCSVCGEVLIPQQVIPESHHYVDWNGVAPTCTTPGYYQGYICITCDRHYDDYHTVPATGHIEVIDEYEAPTCSHVGHSQGSHCAVCKEVIVPQNEIAKTAHTVVIDKAVEPTYDSTGLSQGSHCSVCGEVIVAQQVIPALTKLEILTQPVDYSGVSGKTAVFTVSAKGDGLKYQWYYYRDNDWKKSSSDGYNTPSLSIKITEARDGQLYKCVITDERNSKVTTNAVALHMLVLNVTSQPADYVGKIGTTAVFQVKTDGKDVSYKWQLYKDGAWKNSTLSTANTSTLSVKITEARDGQQYRCVITAANGAKATSEPATIHVGKPLTVTSQPADSYNLIGKNAKFSVEATGETPSYQWQYKNGNVWSDSTKTGSDTSSISIKITEARNGQQYRCKITDKFGVVVYSDAASIHIGQPVTIKNQPSDFTGIAGKTAKFSVEATGEDLTYQWQYYDGTAWRKSTKTGYDTPSLSVKISEERDGQQYRCIIKSSNGAKAISDPAAIHVGEPLTITSQPCSVVNFAGKTAAFSVEATGEELTYQWQYNDGSAWRNSSKTGSDTPVIKIKITEERNGQKYRCKITDKFGIVAYSDVAGIYVGQPFKILSQPSDYVGPFGKYAKFTVNAEGQNLTYQWQYYLNGKWCNSSAAGSNTNAMSIKATEARAGQQYRCLVTNGDGITITSKVVTIRLG